MGSEIWVVYSGTGESVIGGTRLRWGPGDAFVVPSWVPVEHEAFETADLFRVDDAPAMRALELYREQTVDAPQPVTADFAPVGAVT